MVLALRSVIANRYRTAVAVTSSTVYSDALLLETVDDLAHTLPSVFGGVVRDPFPEIETRSLKYTVYEWKCG
jgi:hypothetical protein